MANCTKIGFAAQGFGSPVLLNESTAHRYGSNDWKSQVQNRLAKPPHIVCSGRFATHRLRAFFRSRSNRALRLKTWFRFAGWSSWQPAAKTSRWAADAIEHLVK